MRDSETTLQTIYLAMIEACIARVRAAQAFMDAYKETSSLPQLEAAILQMRKAFEAVAFASIAPSRSEYKAFRAKAERQPDYRMDYHARTIFRDLGKVNKNFYPLPLLPAKRQADGTFHFERKISGYLTKKRFESFYDRFGKYLHVDNPWGFEKHVQNIANDLPVAAAELLSLVELHVTVIQTPRFNGAWVIESGINGGTPRVIKGLAHGEFNVVDG